MKKTILTLTASLLFGAAAVFAQDTTRTDQQRDQKTQQDRYRTEGMVEVQEADLPEAVVTTLEGSQYEGWRDGKVYLDPESGEYIVVLEKSGEASREFRLDRSGTDVTDQSGENQGNQQNPDPMNQETDTAAQQQQGQDDQYRRDDQQQNDQENQNDDALQTDTTMQDQSQQNQNDAAATQTDTTMQDQNQNQDQQYRTEETDTTQMNQEGQVNQQGQNEQDTAQNAETQGAQGDQSATEREEGDESETAYRTDEESRRVGHMEGHYRVIESSELPQAVVTTLNESTYEGWKDNVVYVDTKTGDYIVQAEATAGTGEGKYYRLNKEGKDISKHKKDHKDMDKSKDETSKDKSKTDKSKDDY